MKKQACCCGQKDYFVELVTMEFDNVIVTERYCTSCKKK